jgi:subtilisin-like proprotein convertase family protein
LGTIQLNLDISHPNDSVLKASLISPKGITIILFNRIGGVGDNFTVVLAPFFYPDKSYQLMFF